MKRNIIEWAVLGVSVLAIAALVVTLVIEGLGETYEVVNTNIKRWSVGSPIQAPLDGLLDLIRANGLRAEDVKKLVVRVAHQGANTVNNRDMPDICLQHMCAVMLIDGIVTFAARCHACGLDFSAFNVGDGPAAFLVLIVGALITGLAIALELAVGPPVWVHILLWLPLTLGAVLLSLRAAKAALIALEYRHSAGEGRIEGRR